MFVNAHRITIYLALIKIHNTLDAQSIRIKNKKNIRLFTIIIVILTTYSKYLVGILTANLSIR